ncbi:MAG: hypothetical protein PF436_10960 [Prolixibacteraceae bacterium]|jgi:hypothetical protein|nr:hypothetical protein [Prolixibacteraceae bacterium]
MKTFRIISVMLLFCLFIGCNKENENVKVPSFIEVKAQPIATQTVKSEIQKATSVETEVVFTSDEIVSYNGKTGEIIFQDSGNNESLSTVFKRFNENLEFYMDETLLFSLKSRIVTDIESAIYNEPILQYSILCGDKYYIRDGYPWGLPLYDTTTVRTGQAASAEKVRRTKADKIQEGWKIFVDVLKEEGKYIEN